MDAKSLIDSYVDDVARRLPRKIRNEVGLKLRALLTDELTSARPPQAGDRGCRNGAPSACQFWPAGARRGSLRRTARVQHHRAGACAGLREDRRARRRRAVGVQLAGVFDGSSTFSEWWLESGFAAFWWVGVLVVWFAIGAWIQRRAPIEPQQLWAAVHTLPVLVPVRQDWQPHLPIIHIRRRRSSFRWRHVDDLFVSPEWWLGLLTEPDPSWLRYDDDFRGQLLAPLIVLMATRMALFTVATVSKHWRARTELVRVGLWVTFVAVLVVRSSAGTSSPRPSSISCSRPGCRSSCSSTSSRSGSGHGMPSRAFASQRRSCDTPLDNTYLRTMTMTFIYEIASPGRSRFASHSRSDPSRHMRSRTRSPRRTRSLAASATARTSRAPRKARRSSASSSSTATPSRISRRASPKDSRRPACPAWAATMDDTRDPPPRDLHLGKAVRPRVHGLQDRACRRRFPKARSRASSMRFASRRSRRASIRCRIPSRRSPTGGFCSPRRLAVSSIISPSGEQSDADSRHAAGVRRRLRGARHPARIRHGLSAGRRSAPGLRGTTAGSICTTPIAAATAMRRAANPTARCR